MPNAEATMSELLNFILDHEEAFKSKGRLSSLYSDFRYQQSTNPDGYIANISAWRKALISATRAGVMPSGADTNNLLTIQTGEELSRALTTREWGRPLALAPVIQDAVARKEMVPLQEFLSSKTSIYSRSWIPSPWQVVSWSLRQLGVLGQPGSGDSLAVGNFVVMANVEAAANAILRKINSYRSQVDLIFSNETFAEEFSYALSPSIALTSTDLRILLTHLSRDKAALTFNATTVKFKLPSQANPTPITHQDETIASLRTLILSLDTQIPVLEKRIADMDAQARTAVINKSRTAALSALRSKKLAESTLTRRMDTRAQLEDVFSKIETAADQVEIVRVMKDSAVVLKELNTQIGGVEGVENVVDALREEMSKVDEIQGVIAEPGSEVIDEAEVDEEFEALERAEREKKEAEEAEKTRIRLAELDKLKTKAEEERRLELVKKVEEDRAKIKEAKEEEALEEVLEEEIQELRRVSLDEDRNFEADGQHAEPQRMLA